MLKEKWKIIGLIVILFGSIGTGLWYFYPRSNIQATKTYHDLADIEAMYNADEEIAAAIVKSSDSQLEPADIYRAHRSQKQQLVLAVAGLPDSSTTLRIIDLLKKYQLTATFFVEGINAAADTASIMAISQSGYNIGSYTWVGLNSLEKLEQHKRIADFCRTQKVLAAQLNKAPAVMMCSKTIYTKEVMLDARASGIDSLVKANIYFPRYQLTDETAARQYVRSLPRGSIISIPAGNPVNSVQYEPGKTDERPAEDKQPGIRETVGQSDMPKDNLIDELERFFAALQQEKWTTTNLQEYPIEKFEPAAVPIKALPAS